MGKPQVDIQVDDVTGRWSVDGLPMILMPQHFFLNNHYAIEAVLGPEKLEEVLRLPRATARPISGARRRQPITA